MGFRARPVLVALLGLAALPSAAGAAGITLDLEREIAGNPDHLEVDVLGNLTEAEADAGACVWLHTDGAAKAHGRTEAPGAAEPSDPPRGQPDKGWWFEIACTDTAGNSILDGQAAISYSGKASRRSKISVYFLNEADDAVLATDSLVWNFIGERHRNRTNIFGVPQPAERKPGGAASGAAGECIPQEGPGRVHRRDEGRAGLRQLEVLVGRQRLAGEGVGQEARDHSGQALRQGHLLVQGRTDTERALPRIGGGRFFDLDFGGRGALFLGPTIQALQIESWSPASMGAQRGGPGGFT